MERSCSSSSTGHSSSMVFCSFSGRWGKDFRRATEEVSRCWYMSPWRASAVFCDKKVWSLLPVLLQEEETLHHILFDDSLLSRSTAFRMPGNVGCCLPGTSWLGGSFGGFRHYLVASVSTPFPSQMVLPQESLSSNLRPAAECACARPGQPQAGKKDRGLFYYSI